MLGVVGWGKVVRELGIPGKRCITVDCKISSWTITIVKINMHNSYTFCVLNHGNSSCAYHIHTF